MNLPHLLHLKLWIFFSVQFNPRRNLNRTNFLQGFIFKAYKGILLGGMNLKIMIILRPKAWSVSIVNSCFYHHLHPDFTQSWGYDSRSLCSRYDLWKTYPFFSYYASTIGHVYNAGVNFNSSKCLFIAFTLRPILHFMANMYRVTNTPELILKMWIQFYVADDRNGPKRQVWCVFPWTSSIFNLNNKITTKKPTLTTHLKLYLTYYNHYMVIS